MEQRYNEQIKDLNETISRLKTEKEKVKKDGEAEVLRVKSSMANSRTNTDETAEANQKIEELKEEIRSLKNDKGKGMSDLKLTVENEKKALVSKTEELNAKLK